MERSSFWYKIGSKIGSAKNARGKLFVTLLPLRLSPAPPRNTKIRENVRICRKKVGKMCYHTRKDKKEGGRCRPLFLSAIYFSSAY